MNLSFEFYPQGKYAMNLYCISVRISRETNFWYFLLRRVSNLELLPKNAIYLMQHLRSY